MAEPKVRFKKDDGTSYSNWDEKRLGDVASRVTRKNKNNETDIPLTIASIEGLVDQRTYFGKTIASKDMSGYYLLNKGEFAYNKSYSKGYDYGSIKRLDNYENGALSTLYICFALNEDENSDFYNCYFNGLSWYSQMREICAEGARNHGLLNVSANDFFDITLSVPADGEEQQRISDFFEKVDSLVSTSEKEVEKLQEIKKGCLQKMFPRDGASVPEVRFPEFTGDWEQRKFSDVVDIGSGMDYKHLGEGDIPVYGTGGYMLSVDAALSEDKDAIGIGRKGTIDKPYILRAPFWTVDTLFYCIPKDGYDLDFTSCLFQNVDWKKKDESTGVPSLSKVIINNVETAAPSYEEQRKIGDYFKGIDNLITLHQRECEKYKELKKGLLQQMFV